MPRFLIIVVVLAVLTSASMVRADASSRPRVLDPGGIRVIAAGGITRINREYQLGMEGSLEIGLLPALTFAAPLALTVRVIETRPGSGLFISGGVVDLNLTEWFSVLYAPALVIFGQSVLGPSSCFRGALDFTSIRRDLETESLGFWMRGSMAVLIDFGPFVSVAAGASYQRVVYGGGAPEAGMLEAGWVSDSRVSFGAVRSQPYYDLPTVSIHVGDAVDIFAMVRFDVDLFRNTNDMRMLAGIEIH